MKNKLFTLVFAWLFTLAMIAAPGVHAQQGFDFKTKQAVASDFNGWRVYSVSTTNNTSGAGKTITIEDPRVTIQGFGQINPIVANSTFVVDTGAVQETVTATSVSCTSPVTCSFTATFSNAHSGRFQITSGSFGAQEALDYLTNSGGQGAVLIQPYFPGTTSTITSLVRGNANIVIEDQRGGSNAYYGWTGAAYIVAFSIGAPFAQFGGSTTVAALPAAAAGNFGQVRLVTDSTAVAAEGQTCAGSSSNKAIAISNGTVWKCF